MAKNGFKAMDSDMHVMEPCDLLAALYRSEVSPIAHPAGYPRHKRDLGIQVDGKIMPRPPWRRPTRAPRLILGNAYSKKSTPRKKPGTSITLLKSVPWTKKDWMSRYSIPAEDCSFSPSTAWTRNSLPPSLKHTTTGCTTFAKWLPIACTAKTRHRRAARCLLRGRRNPPHRKRNWDLESILMRPNHVNGRNMERSVLQSAVGRGQEAGYPGGFSRSRVEFIFPQPALSQFIPSFTMFNTLSFPMANMFACADMIYGGVMERFPKLKVAYLEGNCAWIPWLLWRMGEYAELTGIAEHPEMKLEPLEYFQRQCWGAVECDEVVAKNLPDFGLEDNIVFSTDFPALGR